MVDDYNLYLSIFLLGFFHMYLEVHLVCGNTEATNVLGILHKVGYRAWQ
jgi:hypothetical protein